MMTKEERDLTANRHVDFKTKTRGKGEMKTKAWKLKENKLVPIKDSFLGGNPGQLAKDTGVKKSSVCMDQRGKTEQTEAG